MTDLLVTLLDSSVDTVAANSTHVAALPGLLDPVAVLGYFGSWALFGLLLVILLESGVLFPLLPGDSLLFVAGMVVAAGGAQGIDSFASLWQLLVFVPLAAVIGGQIGYWIGRYAGTSMFADSNRFLKRKYVTEAEKFFDRHGPVTVLAARFVPVVRTLTPLVAGAARMRYRIFFAYNIIGAIAWGCGVTLLGYWLGNHSFIQRFIDPIFVLIAAISMAPIAWEAFARRRRARITRTPEPADR